MLPPQVEKKIPQGVKIVQVADGGVDHKHHLESVRPTTSEENGGLILLATFCLIDNTVITFVYRFFIYRQWENLLIQFCLKTL